MELGIIFVAQTPPLSVLEGWKTRAKILKRNNVISIKDFLLADTKRLAGALDMTSEEIDNVKKGFLALLSAPDPRTMGRC
jgi:hypothetical protein